MRTAVVRITITLFSDRWLHLPPNAKIVRKWVTSLDKAQIAPLTLVDRENEIGEISGFARIEIFRRRHGVEKREGWGIFLLKTQSIFGRS